MHLDTDKYAKAIASKILLEEERFVEEGKLIVESTKNKVLLKNKFGIRDYEHITEDQPVKKSSENLDEKSENGDSDKDEKKVVNAASESEDAEG